MSKVTFIHKGGREQVMAQRYADILQKVGRGTYLTRDMAAAAPFHAVPPSSPVVVTTAVAAPALDLEAMDAEQLHAIARERGVKVHHKAGADKVRAALREAAE